MIYYNSRHLSEKLDINLAKWKRWAREFLPPDPLGGLQSGVARQFNSKEAFKVYLGGYLVGTVGFSVPQAARILADMNDWLKSNGFFKIHANLPATCVNEMPCHDLCVYPLPGQGFGYVVKTIVAVEEVDGDDGLWQQRFVRTILPDTAVCDMDGSSACAFVIGLTTLYRDFLERLA